MAQKTEERGVTTGLVVGAIGGGAVAAVIAALLAGRPARAAPIDEKLDYLIECLTTLVPVLADVSERQATLIQLLEQWLAAQGIPGIPGVPSIEVTVSTPWVYGEPIHIFNRAIRDINPAFSDFMVDFRQGKRMYVKVESSLDQAVLVQPIGNYDEDIARATNLGPAGPCPVGGNISFGLGEINNSAPFIGMAVTAGIAPTAGLIDIWVVIQS